MPMYQRVDVAYQSAHNWWQTETQLPKPLAFVFLIMLFQSVYI